MIQNMNTHNIKEIKKESLFDADFLFLFED
jgi:hypothetical protein